MLLLIGIKVEVGDGFGGGDQEPTSATRRIIDGFGRAGPHDLDDGLDQRTWSEVLACSRLEVGGILLEKTLVEVSLTSASRISQSCWSIKIDNQPAQLGRILDPVLRLAK